MKTIAPGIVVLLLAMSESAGLAASFDCTKAQTQVEKMICQDTALGTLDEAMVNAYRDAKRRVADPNALVRNQREWLQTTRNKCITTSCLLEVYQQRIRFLEQQEAATESAPLTRIGQCTNTSVAKLGTRLGDEDANESVPGSGTAIWFANNIYLVAYETIPQAEASRPGDKVKMCLTHIPSDCPPGDDRGKVYTVTNMRTKQRFTMADSSHECGGA